MLGRTNTGGGGGGGGLNFQVIGGTTAPNNPKENTIWVNTSTKITGWVFSASEPEQATQGMVWISVGTSSSTAFNALKKNGITVYPIFAKQYVSGAWFDKVAKSYQNGEWVDWFMYLYKTDNDFAEITGGWVSGSKILFTGSGTTTVPPTVTKNGNSTTLSINQRRASGTFYALKKINTSNFDKLCVDVLSGSCFNGQVLISLMDSLDKNPEGNAIAMINLEYPDGYVAAGTYDVPITDCNGEYYIGVSVRTYEGTSITFEFSKIYMQ